MITVCGVKTTLENLRAIQLVRPSNAGGRWKGVSHSDSVDAILRECDRRKWQVNNTKFSVDGVKDCDDTELVGAFDLTIPDLDAPDGQSFSLGLMTSNSMKRSMRLFVGTNIFLCSNGMASGEVVLQRKHTTNFNIFDAIRPALDSYFIAAQQIPLTVDGLKNNRLSRIESDSLILESGRNQIIPWSRVGRLDDEYRNPTHNHGENTSWSLLNAFTEVVKKSPVHAQMDQMNKFRDILPTTLAA